MYRIRDDRGRGNDPRDYIGDSMSGMAQALAKAGIVKKERADKIEQDREKAHTRYEFVSRDISDTVWKKKRIIHERTRDRHPLLFASR